MAPTVRTIRRRGMVLLLTLVTLVVLAAVVVRYQANVSLLTRSSDHRVEKLKCRYGAESGLMTGTKLVRLVITEQRRELQQMRQSPPTPVLTDAEQADESEVEDPNADQVARVTPRGQRPSYVVNSQTFELEDVEVTLEIHDESAKYPVLWAFSSPFTRTKADTRAALRNLAGRLALDPRMADDVGKLISGFSQEVRLPPPDVVVAVGGGQDDSRRQGRSRHRTLSQRRDEEQQRRQVMGQFALEFYAALEEDPERREMDERLENVDASFVEYLGLWGGNRVNLNTAPPEVLWAAFEPVGMTETALEAILRYREQTPFTHASKIYQVDGVPRELADVINQLGTAVSRSYSVHVTAQLGRTRKLMYAGLYLDERSRMQISGMASGG